MGYHIKSLKILLIILWLFLGEFSSPGHNLYFLTFIQFIPLFFLISIDRDNWFKISFITGFFYYCLYYRWLVYPVKFTDFSPEILGPVNVILMAIYQTIYFVIFCYFFKRFINGKNVLIILAPVLWGILEYLKSILLTGFPWGELSYNLYKCPFLIQLANVIKSEGISSIIIFFNILFFCILFSKERKKYLFVFAFSVLIFSTLNFYILKKTPSTFSLPPSSLKIALIQGNVPEKLKLHDENAEKIIDIYINLTKKILKYKPDLVIWPESTYIISFEQDNSSLNKKFENFLKQTKINLIFGSPSVEFDSKTFKYRFYNSMYLIKNGDIKNFQKYNKIHLVPFGEYTPLKEILSFVNKIVPGEDFSPGKKMVIFKVKNLKIIPLICYEGIFANLIKAGEKLGGEIIVNISNEAWFGKSFALYQHIAADVLRTVESGKFFIKCANSGISAIISPKGKILKFLKPEIRGTIITSLSQDKIYE